MIKRKHFAVVLMDQAHNMFISHEESNDVEFIHKTPEHLSRIMELSENQHIFMDYHTFVALGRTTIGNRFCRIFCDTQSQIAEVGLSTFWRVHHRSELTNITKTSNYYNPDTVIFYLGAEQFMNECFQHCSKLLLTVIDQETEIPEGYKAMKFPLENAKYYFSKRKDIVPEMMAPIAEYKLLKYGTSKIESKVEIADNGMKIIKKVELKQETKYDAIFDAPNYMFYEFSK